MKNALIYHTDIDPKTATPDDLDVLDEAEFISETLSRLGYAPISLPFDINRAMQEIPRINPLFIFNLVEVINGKEALNYLAPELFEQLHVPYTGCTKEAFVRTSSKTHAKTILDENQIPTPFFVTYGDMYSRRFQGKRFIVKSSEDHASKGLEAVLYPTEQDVIDALNLKGKGFFAEEYIDGREFNVSVIGNLGNPQVLPVAEMQFQNWPAGKPKIVDYSAKWDSDCQEYKATIRTFDFPEKDKRIVESLESISRACWNAFDLRGYARVDFRVSEQGQPYVLEINANPCISPDAGFIAAAEKAGFSHEQIIRKIIQDSCNL